MRVNHKGQLCLYSDKFCQEGYCSGCMIWLEKVEKDKKEMREEKLVHCAGCHCDFYNGQNPMNIKECWSLDKAKLVMRKKVGVNDVPPWRHTPRLFLNCYRENGYVMVEPDKEC